MIAALIASWLIAGLSPNMADELDRLKGHKVAVAADGSSYRIEDIAGEGAPRVGRVERRSSELWLVPAQGDALLLRGPLAIPRIAGPGYRVWVIGKKKGDELWARRLGVLAPPMSRNASPASSAQRTVPPRALPARPSAARPRSHRRDAN